MVLLAVSLASVVPSYFCHCSRARNAGEYIGSDRRWPRINATKTMDRVGVMLNKTSVHREPIYLRSNSKFSEELYSFRNLRKVPYHPPSL
ncbi:hypothetical protein B0T20DRAFT_119320 [Sordaria brevicollis]|uniref:Secreted protein n=1 Tax=Sordaria brevicollis TaxID=83679 RepID=A0AAE0PKL6_SORBR|nr:hypothetical protein B0T20DRAFT_119320 [Sordaria brevicollis]